MKVEIKFIRLLAFNVDLYWLYCSLQKNFYQTLFVYSSELSSFSMWKFSPNYVSHCQTLANVIEKLSWTHHKTFLITSNNLQQLFKSKVKIITSYTKKTPQEVHVCGYKYAKLVLIRAFYGIQIWILIIVSFVYSCDVTLQKNVYCRLARNNKKKSKVNATKVDNKTRQGRRIQRR